MYFAQCQGSLWIKCSPLMQGFECLTIQLQCFCLGVFLSFQIISLVLLLNEKKPNTERGLHEYLKYAYIDFLFFGGGMHTSFPRMKYSILGFSWWCLDIYIQSCLRMIRFRSILIIYLDLILNGTFMKGSAFCECSINLEVLPQFVSTQQRSFSSIGSVSKGCKMWHLQVRIYGSLLLFSVSTGFWLQLLI